MNNSFVQNNGRVFRQVSCTAMGTAVAPPFANLYLHFKFRQVFAMFSPHILYARRYIDDGFVILRQPEAAQNFSDALEAHCNLHFTITWDQTSVLYPDLEIYEGTRCCIRGILDFQVYTKPISKFLYLHGKSNHPRHVHTGKQQPTMLDRMSMIQQM